MLRPFALAAALMAACALPMAAPSMAATFPDKPVRLVVGYPAGGTLDGPARVLAVELSKLSGQNFIVENRPGATANIAAEYVARSEPDGYTILLSSASLSSSGALYKNLGFDPLADFHHIGMFCTLPTVIVARNDLPAKTLADVVALAKKEPGKLTFGSPGTGTGAHLAGEVLNRYAGTNIVHVPFKGSAQAVTSVLGGHIDLMIAGLATLSPTIKSGKVRALAVTNAQRADQLPDVPTIAQAVPDYKAPDGYEFSTWLGVAAPAKTPEDVVQRLQSLLQQALADAKTRNDLIGIGVSPTYLPGDALAKKIADEIPAYKKVVTELKIKFD